MWFFLMLGVVLSGGFKECDPSGSYGECEIVVEVPAPTDTTPPPWTEEYTPAPSTDDPGSTDSGDEPVEPSAYICADVLATMWAASPNARPWGTPVTVSSPDWIFTDYDPSPVRGEVRANFQMADPPSACNGLDVFLAVRTYRGVVDSATVPQCLAWVEDDPVQSTDGSNVWTSVRGECH